MTSKGTILVGTVGQGVMNGAIITLDGGQRKALLD